jgi:hypothetical protein
MDTEQYERFSVMLGESFRHSLEDFRKEWRSLTNTNHPFRDGYLLAFHRMFTLIEQAASVYEIPLDKLGLDGLNEQDFLE